MPEPLWQDLGSIEELKRRPLTQINLGRMKIALSYVNGQFGAVSGTCNHAGGPLARAPSMASTSSVPGTTGSFTAGPGWESPGTRKTRFPATTSRRRKVGS